MKTFFNILAAGFCVVILGMGAIAPAQARVVLSTQGPNYQQAPSSIELVFEGALAEPMGDQDGDFQTTNNGFGASTGYQVGIRVRQYLWRHFAVTPVFQYTRLGAAAGVTGTDIGFPQAYNIRTSSYRYGLDFQSFVGSGAAPVRLMFLGGISLINNQYRDWLQDSGVFKASANTPGASVGAGLQMKNIELIAEYTYNRFRTGQFSFDGTPQDYNWDLLVVRAGLRFGR